MVRYGVIGAGTAGVPLLFGKPMSEAIRTALFTAVGEGIGGGAETTQAKVRDVLQRAVKESPEGTVTGETLRGLGQEGTLGMRTGSEGARYTEQRLRDMPLIGRGLRKTYARSEEVLSDELKRVEARLSPQQIQGNPDVLVKESIEAAKGRLDAQANQYFGGVDLMIANRQRPPLLPGCSVPTACHCPAPKRKPRPSWPRRSVPGCPPTKASSCSWP